MKKLLLVFPNPDDESFLCCGTIAKYAAAECDVYSVYTTDERSGEKLGLSTDTYLGFKDGTLRRLSPGELEDRVFREMVRFVPEVVITYGPKGITNHPDHTKLSVSTTVAFQRYVQDVKDLPQFASLTGVRQRRLGHTYKASFDACLALEHEPRLYYACLPESVVGYHKKLKLILGQSYGTPWVGTPDKFITTVINIKRFQSKKIKALDAHQPQVSNKKTGKLLSFVNNPIFSNEYFILRMSGYDEVFMGKNDHVSNRL